MKVRGTKKRNALSRESPKGRGLEREGPAQRRCQTLPLVGTRRAAFIHGPSHKAQVAPTERLRHGHDSAGFPINYSLSLFPEPYDRCSSAKIGRTVAR